MKYYIVAGEASGDLHGSNLIKAIKRRDDDADFRVFGGDLMENAGGVLAKHYRDMAFMGFVEVVKNLRTILGNIRYCKKDIEGYQPDVLILIDLPGFNLRIAKWARKKGLRIVYYISPQLWAWNTKRVHKIKRDVDRMLVIFPFEKAFYKKYGVEVDFVGHPLLDAIPNHQTNAEFLKQNQLNSKPIIALLPGSRKQEIRKMLGQMLTVAPYFLDYQFVVAGAPAITAHFYQNILSKFREKHPNITVTLTQNQTYDLLQHAAAALVTSGTATLETALFKVPQVVCYKGNPISFQIAKRIVDINYIAMPNLIMDRAIVKELIQGDFTTENLKLELTKVLEPSHRKNLLVDYQMLKERLGGAGASEKAGEIIHNLVI